MVKKMSPHKRGPNKKNLLIQSTVGKRAKRMPDTTVETTFSNSPKPLKPDLW